MLYYHIDYTHTHTHIYIYIYTHTHHYVYNSIQQSPSSEANRSSSSHEIPSILWNRKVHYHIHKRLPLVPILSWIHPVHFPSHFLNINFNIILPSTPRFFKLCVHQVSHQNPVFTSPISHTCHMPSPSHCSSID